MIKEILNNKNIDKNLFVFDLDGTLVDTDEANFLAYKEAIKKIMNINLKMPYTKNERYTRKSLYSTVEKLTTEEYRNIIKIKNNVFYKYLEKSKINKVALKSIARIPKKNKIILATNSSKNRANMILKYHNLKESFNFIFYKEDYATQNIENKFEYILKNLKIDPSLVIIFEDDINEAENSIRLGTLEENIFIIPIKAEKND